MNHLIDLGVCALAGCTNFIIYKITFERYFKRIFGCSKLMLHSKCPLLGERRKRKYCKTVRMDQVGLKLY